MSIATARDTTVVSTRSWGPIASVVPRHGYRGRPMTGCTLMDPLGAEAVRQPGLLSRWRGAYVLGKFSR
jgi:hypothetical protein